MRLRTKTSHIHNLPEGKAPRRLLPVLMKYIYLLLLLTIVSGVVYLIAVKYLYFTGVGEVEVKKIVLSSKHGGTVHILPKQENMTFSADELLAVIDKVRDCQELVPDTRLIRLRYEILAKKKEYEIYTLQLKTMQPAGRSSIVMRALEIGDTSSQRKFEEVQKEYDTFQQKILLLAAEIATSKEELAALELILAPQQNIACEQETITSPFPGTMYHITKTTNEYIAQGEPLLVVVAHQAEVQIEGYFDNNLLRYLRNGESLHIEFPDGSASQGIIAEISSSARYAPEVIRDMYVPVEPLLRVELTPATGEGIRWYNYDRMQVRIKGRRL